MQSWLILIMCATLPVAGSETCTWDFLLKRNTIFSNTGIISKPCRSPNTTTRNIVFTKTWRRLLFKKKNSKMFLTLEFDVSFSSTLAISVQVRIGGKRTRLGKTRTFFSTRKRYSFYRILTTGSEKRFPFCHKYVLRNQFSLRYWK